MRREKPASEGIAIDDNHIYMDRGISGGTIERGAFQQMLSNIEAGTLSETVYPKDDERLFRNECEAGELVEWICEHEVEYVIAWLRLTRRPKIKSEATAFYLSGKVALVTGGCGGVSATTLAMLPPPGAVRAFTTTAQSARPDRGAAVPTRR